MATKIDQLPPEQKENYKQFLSCLDAKNYSGANAAITSLLKYFVGAKQELPSEIEIHYGRLLLLETTQQI